MPVNQIPQKFIIFAIHTPEYASKLKSLLEKEGIDVNISPLGAEFNNQIQGVRIMVKNTDLPQAMRIVENKEIFWPEDSDSDERRRGEILVPVDFTSYSYQALVQAFKLAHSLNLKVVLFHTYLDPTTTAKIHLSEFYSYTAAAAKEVEQMRKVEDEAMNRFEERIRSDIKNGLIPAVSFSRVLREGVPEDEILEYSKLTNPEIIIMGTRDSAQKEKDLVGSISAEVLDSCKEITLTIPAGCSDFNISNIRNIVFFAQLNQRDIIGLNTLSSFFPDKELNISLMHIPSRSDKFINPAKALNGLADYARRRFPNFRIERPKFNEENPAESFNEFKYDLAVIVNKKRNPISRLFNPGFAHKLLFHEDFPMMVVPV